MFLQHAPLSRRRMASHSAGGAWGDAADRMGALSAACGQVTGRSRKLPHTPPPHGKATIYLVVTTIHQNTFTVVNKRGSNESRQSLFVLFSFAYLCGKRVLTACFSLMCFDGSNARPRWADESQLVRSIFRVLMFETNSPRCR